MSARVWIAYGLLAGIVLVLVSGGVYLTRYMIQQYTYEVGELRTETATIDLAGAEVVHAQVDMGVGELYIAGTANPLTDESLMQAEFTFNVDALQPVITYTVTAGRGELVIQHTAPSTRRIPNLNSMSAYQADWHLYFTDHAPLDLAIEMGVGEANLTLAGLPLQALAFELGVGEANIDLRGDWPRDLRVRLSGGTGATRVLLPSNVGVRVQAEKGIGGIQTMGLQQNGDRLVNEAYGASEVTIDLDVETGIGEICLLVEGMAAGLDACDADQPESAQ